MVAPSWVTVTAALAWPGAVDSKTAEPVPEESAATVTRCAVLQLDGVKVRVAPEDTDSPVLPLARAVVTVTFAFGCLESFTSKAPDSPWRTPSWDGLATTAGPAATVMPTGVEEAEAPRLSYAFATSECAPTARPPTDSVNGAEVSVPSSSASS